MKNKVSLSHFNLRATPIREEMITLFMNNQGVALSEAEINQLFNHKADRVSIYRTVKILLDKMLIHKVICENGILKYALNQKHPHHHPHFQCTACGKVICLGSKGLTQIDMPTGYTKEATHLLVKGLCPACGTVV